MRLELSGKLAGHLLRHAGSLGLQAGVASVLVLQGRLAKAGGLALHRSLTKAGGLGRKRAGLLLLLLLRLAKGRRSSILRLLLLLLARAKAVAGPEVGVLIHCCVVTRSKSDGGESVGG